MAALSPDPASIKESTSPPAAVESPAPAAAGGAEAKPESSSKVDPSAPSLLEAAKPIEAKPEDQPKTEEAKAEEAKPLEPVTYQPFTFPEGWTPAEDRANAFTEILARHRAPQELGQELVNYYMDEVRQAGEVQTKVWDDLQTTWVKEVREDKDIGGDKLPTVLSRAARLMDTTMGEDSAKLREVLTLTGAGNNPVVIKFMDKVALAMGEARAVPAQGGPAPQPKGRIERRYGNTTKGAT